MKVFLTYANDKFKAARQLFAGEITGSGFFDRIIEAGPEDLPLNDKVKAEPYISFPKGGGYWIWKPIIVKKIFDQLEEGDILFYADAGCVYNPQGKERMKEYFEILTPEKPILRFQMNLTERAWTIGQIFDHFSVRMKDPIRESGQLVGGIFFLLKNKLSQAQVDLWYGLALEKTILFTDFYNIDQPDPEFKENRHDQSLWSIIAKKYPQEVTVLPDECYPFRIDKPIWAARRR